MKRTQSGRPATTAHVPAGAHVRYTPLQRGYYEDKFALASPKRTVGPSVERAGAPTARQCVLLGSRVRRKSFYLSGGATGLRSQQLHVAESPVPMLGAWCGCRAKRPATVYCQRPRARAVDPVQTRDEQSRCAAWCSRTGDTEGRVVRTTQAGQAGTQTSTAIVSGTRHSRPGHVSRSASARTADAGSLYWGRRHRPGHERLYKLPASWAFPRRPRSPSRTAKRDVHLYQHGRGVGAVYDTGQGNGPVATTDRCTTARGGTCEPRPTARVRDWTSKTRTGPGCSASYGSKCRRCAAPGVGESPRSRSNDQVQLWEPTPGDGAHLVSEWTGKTTGRQVRTSEGRTEQVTGTGPPRTEASSRHHEPWVTTDK